MNAIWDRVLTAGLGILATLLVQRFALKPKLVFWHPSFISFPIPPSAGESEKQAPSPSGSAPAANPPVTPHPPGALPTSGGSLHISTLTVQNTGAREATNLVIAHPVRPPIFRLYPPLKYTETTLDSGEHLIEIPTLAPREWVSLHTAWPFVPQEVVYVKSDQGHAVPVPFQLNRVPSRWALALWSLIVLVGATTTLYWLVRLAVWVYPQVLRFIPG